LENVSKLLQSSQLMKLKETMREMVTSKRNEVWADSLFLDKSFDQSSTKVGVIASSWAFQCSRPSERENQKVRLWL